MSYSMVYSLNKEECKEQFLPSKTNRSFEHIYRTYAPKIYRYILFRVNSFSDAEDITAEVFIKLLSSDNAPKDIDQVFPWLYKVAGNLSINHLKRHTKRYQLEIQGQRPQEPFPDSYAWSDGEVWQVISRLKFSQQQVIYLRIFEDMSFKSIARLLSKNEGSVKMLFYRGVKKLKKMLGNKEDANV